MLYVANAFSLSMLPPAERERGALAVRTISRGEAAAILASGCSWVSAVGHASTAALFSEALGTDIRADGARRNIALTLEDEVLVGQYVGPRLPEGATTLPEGASIVWMLVTLSAGDILRHLERRRPSGGFKIASEWRWSASYGCEPSYRYAHRECVVIGEFASHLTQEQLPSFTVCHVHRLDDGRWTTHGWKGLPFASLEEACAYSDSHAREDGWDVPEDTRPPAPPAAFGALPREEAP
jgi:hypothetical protein